MDASLAAISKAVSVLGVTALAAYFGILKVGEPKKGETVVVSGVAVSVGSTAVQIAKIIGCRMIVIAGSEAKTDYL